MQKGASGKRFPMIGETNCNVTFKGETRTTTIYVSQNEDLNVFGSDLLNLFDLWKIPIDDFCVKENIFSIIVSNDYTNSLNKNFSSCFENSLGKCEHFKAHLTLKPDSSPPFIPAKAPVKTQLQSWPIPSKPWERLHINYAGPYRNFHFLVVVDAYSKWIEVIKTSTISSSKTITMLNSIFARFGTPQEIVSDNGTQFTSEQFQSWCNVNGIHHILTSPYSPMSNGQAERFVDTFKRSMKKLESEGNIDDNLEVFLKTFRSTPNVNCPDQKSPAEVLLGRKIRSTLDLLKPPEIVNTKRNSKMEIQLNKKHGAKNRTFNIDDTVFVMIHKGNSWYWEEGWIIDRLGNVNYSVSTKDKLIRAHANQIKTRFIDSLSEDSSLSLFTIFENFN